MEVREFSITQHFSLFTLSLVMFSMLYWQASLNFSCCFSSAIRTGECVIISQFNTSRGQIKGRDGNFKMIILSYELFQNGYNDEPIETQNSQVSREKAAQTFDK